MISMSFREIRKKYPDEWVLIEYADLNDDFSVKKGKVLRHSANKNEIFNALSHSYGKNVSVEYTGPLDAEPTFM